MAGIAQEREAAIQPASLPRTSPLGSRLRLYLLAVLLVPTLGYFLVYPLVKLPSLRWGGSKWAPALDYPYRTHLDADVVVFGDSSAFLGISPTLLDAQLGTHSVVLPNTIGSLAVTRDMALRSYLAHNRAPRLIVFYFVPWNLDFEHTERTDFFFEGEEMLFRHGSWKAIAAFARKHPHIFLLFPWQRHGLLDLDFLLRRFHADPAQEIARERGHADYRDPRGAMDDNCKIPDRFVPPQDIATLQSFVREYTAAQTQTVVYLAPIPQCGATASRIARPVAPLHAAAPTILPSAWFAWDGLYSHILPAHVPVTSKLLANALRPLLPAPGKVEPSKP